MADILNVTGSNYTSGSIERGESSEQLNTGALRRQYNFGSRVSELKISQDPFFRLASKSAKKPTDDPSFKFTERRGSWHKRYAYVVAHGTSSAVSDVDGVVAMTAINAGDEYYFKMGTDYESNGNRQNVYGQSNSAIAVGAIGTKPEFYIPGQLIKINVSEEALSTTAGAVQHFAAQDYIVAKVTDVTASGEYAILKTEIVKESTLTGVNSTNLHISSFLYTVTGGAWNPISAVYGEAISSSLEPKRSYVVGSVFDKGTGYPETWQDQPFSTAYGQTQIWKTSMAMDNTDRATVLKYEKNEWARIWKEKLVEHKWDIEQSLLFGSQNSDYRTTQGAVSFISSYGNVFSLDISTKTADDFLEDMSSFLDPRYNNGKSTVFFVNTAVYNWLHKLGGYFGNNIGIGTGNSTNNFRADLAVAGRKKVLGLDTTVISTVYGDMNVIRNIHLDGTNIKMLAIDMKHCAYRPLVGNGLNRDTTVYVGVQTLENSGVDRRVDQIITEAGMEWSMPEAHAIWS